MTAKNAAISHAQGELTTLEADAKKAADAVAANTLAMQAVAERISALNLELADATRRSPSSRRS